MTSKERVHSALLGQETDYCPVINPTTLVTYESMLHTGCFFPQAHTDTDKMAALAAYGHTVLGFDTIMPYLSLHLEAAALSCQIDWGYADKLPSVTIYPIKDLREFTVPSNFLDRKPIKSLLAAIRILKHKHGKDTVIVGKVVGPWTLAYHLYGAANILMDIIIEPLRVVEALHELKEISMLFAQAQMEAGADMITWSDHVTGDLVSPQIYSDYLLPIHQDCMRKLQVPVVLHVCGNVMDRLHLFANGGFAAFHIDSRNPIPEALEIVKGKMMLTGNINIPNILLNGSTAEVREEVTAVIRDGIRLISPECGLPTRVPNANLFEVVKTARRCSCGKGVKA